jgi:hypothetical protein
VQHYTKGEKIMKTSVQSRSSGLNRFVITAFVVTAFLAFTLPQMAHAATSGGATIYNTVKVTYASGTSTLFASANVSITVNTVGAVPTVTNPAGQTVAAGANVSYPYVVKSNANGLDTYTTSVLTNTAANVSAASAT